MGKTAASIRELWVIIRSWTWEILVSCIPGVVRIASSLCFVWVSKVLVDIATGSSTASLSAYIWIMVASVLVMIASFACRSWLEEYLLVRITNKMRQDRFRDVIYSKYDASGSFHSADMVNRLEEDVRTVAELVCTRTPDTLVTLLQLVAACIFMAYIQPSLLLVLIIVLPLSTFGGKFLFGPVRKLNDKIRGKDSEVQKIMQESLQNRLVVKSLGQEERLVADMAEVQQEIKTASIHKANYSNIARSIMALGFRAGYLAAFFWGIYGIMQGTATYGMMTAFLQLVGQIQMPLSSLSSNLPSFVRALTSVDRLKDLENMESGKAGGEERLEGPFDVQLEEISFCYPGNSQNVLENFSYDIKAGKVYAIVGPTGRGKSTLVKIIMGLLAPQKGSVTLRTEGCSIAASENAIINFSYVPQGNSLISTTVRRNLLLAKPEATEAEMISALQDAQASFVLELPQGLDTPCFEKGAGLSEGQAQRIAIARALLSDRGMFIFDEATSALDADTEQHLLANLGKRLQGKSVIWITHRDSVLGYADEVIRL